MLAEILLIAVGFALLVVGGEILVRGAVDLAERLKVSAFVIGAVIIGFGSSVPELVTSIKASLSGAPGIAIGNIVGSNIINILVVLGIAAVIAPIAITGRHVRFDTVVVCGLSFAFVTICAVFQLTPVVGAAFLVALAIYLTFSIHREMRSVAPAAQMEHDNSAIEHEHSSAVPASPTTFAWMLVTGAMAFGFGSLVLGGHLVVGAAVSLAAQAGVSETIVGLTVVAFSTSLPEIVTAVVAAVRRQADVALGNVLGSCVFNLLAIGGAIAILSPASVPPEIVHFDNMIMVAAALILLMSVCLLRHIGRPLGVLFLGGYAAYLTAIWP